MRTRLTLALSGVSLLLPWASLQALPNGESALDELLAIPVSAASKLEQTSMRAPASVMIITAEEISRFGWQTVAEALSSVTGLYLSYDRNYSYVGVRGFSRPTDYNSRILVMLDGMRVTEGVYGSAAIGTDLPLEMRAVERIEIVRGPGSAAFGTAAMLAVVNVVTRDPASSSGGAVAVEGGDFDRVAGSVRGVTSSKRRLRIAWSALASSSGGADHFYPEYESEAGGGVSEDADWDRNRGMSVRASYDAFRFSAYASSRSKGIPTGAYETDLGDRRDATTDSWTLLGIGWSRAFAAGWSVQARAQAGKYAYDGIYPADGVLYLDSTDNNWWSAELQATWEPRPESRSTAGIEWRENRKADFRYFDELGNVYFDIDLPYRIAALYAEQEFQLTEALLLTLGARYDDYSISEGAFSPRLALVYLPNRTNSLKLLAGSAFRAPNAYEIADGVSGGEADMHSELEPETIESLEVVWERRFSPALMGSLSAFRFRMSDLIDQRVDSSDEHIHYVNVDSATSVGAALELSARFPSGLWIHAGASLQRANDDVSGERLSNSPEWKVNLKLSAPFAGRGRGAIEVLHEAGRDSVVSTTTEPFLLVNATLAWELARIPVSIQLQARNLLDEDYALPGGVEHRQASIPQDGRALTLRFELRF